MIGVFSSSILNLPHLETLLGAPTTRVRSLRPPTDLTAVAGWGYKPTAAQARRYALRHALPYLALEDGFLRSVGLGAQDPPLSLIVDDLSIYYDATTVSRLETLIAQPLSPGERARAIALRMAWQAARVSKYNHLPEHRAALPHSAVLVVDQTFGDPAISHGLAHPASFWHMLETALAEHPDASILLKIHPDVFAGKKRGHFKKAALARLKRVRVLTQDVHPVALLERVAAVYTVTSQLGFEALLWGLPVRTFGMPFYAGWGLTQDALPAPERRQAADLEQLTHAALIAYPRYLDPETGTRCEVERLLEWLGLQRRLRERFAGTVRAVGFSPWKRPLVRSFLQGSQLDFTSRMTPVAARETLAVWGMATTPAATPTLRLEDGFLRSVGLGADLIRPLSWVIDARGMYYDATQASDLEMLLETADFDASLLVRARALRQRIVAAGVTKYNVGTAVWQRPAGVRQVILVPGQVETDASIRRGAPGMRRNLELLQAARTARPDAYLIYKPHPDVLAGLRARGAGELRARDWCDAIVADAPMGTLLEQVDELHVLTSLAGFEALLRDKPVICYGQPFYAGWGLTIDREPLARRTRRLSLEMLVAGALLLYPTYVSRTTGRFTTAERALDELLDWRAREVGALRHGWRRLLRPLLGWNAARRDRAG